MSFVGHEIIGQTPYKELLKTELKNPAFWGTSEYSQGNFEYNHEGSLVLRRYGSTVSELLEKYGDSQNAPIQITDLLEVKEKAALLKGIFIRGAMRAGYPTENLQFHLAAKANFKGPVVDMALQEVNMETSGELDLSNFIELRRLGAIPANCKVVCNGFKGERDYKFDKGYGPTIIEAYKKDIDVTPVLVPNELPFYLSRVDGKHGKLKVGLRLKFGTVTNDYEQEALVSRFGFQWNDLRNEAEKVYQSKNLEFTMLHAMVAAASAVKPEVFVKSALYAAEKYAELKGKYPSLTHLNLGGGIPSLDSGYNYDSFLFPYLKGVMEICRKHNVDLPVIVVESGSFITTDSENLIYRVVDVTRNSSDNVPWVTINGILTNIPDIWIQEDPFTFVAGNNANEPTGPVRIGDLTCDSNNVYPPKDQPNKYVVLPRKLDNLVIVAIHTGAYQDVISGIGSAKEAKMVLHCGNPEPIQVYLSKDRQGQTRIVSSKRASVPEESGIVGVDKDLLQKLGLLA